MNKECNDTDVRFYILDGEETIELGHATDVKFSSEVDIADNVRAFDLRTAFSGVLEIGEETFTKLSEAFSTIIKAQTEAMDRFEALSIVYGREDPLDDCPKDFDQRFKRYDKVTKAQCKQYQLNRYRNKNYPYRRCDRSE